MRVILLYNEIMFIQIFIRDRLLLFLDRLTQVRQGGGIITLLLLFGRALRGLCNAFQDTMSLQSDTSSVGLSE